VNFSHQLLQKKKPGSGMSRVGEIKDEDSESGVKMMKGLLVVELFSKSCFLDVVVTLVFFLVFSFARVLTDIQLFLGWWLW
jgi:hypothetical protein